MSDVAIRVEGLGKKYRLGAKQQSYGSLRESLVAAADRPVRLAKRLAGRGAAPSERQPEFWALKDVSFEVKHGEVLGIIGRNGAGKSTLLKLLSEITEPTTGRITMNGRVASLLEVGTGFHPELTGRENIYLNGAILGMSKAEIARKFDEIVAFAEVEQFIDTQVKHYSSGMYLRLAFAVAAHLEPEILVVDEVLAVGDLAFQKKCMGKMGAISRGGRTVLFVSHDLAAINALCHRGLLLKQGRVAQCGPTTEVIGEYSRGAQLTGAYDNTHVRQRSGLFEFLNLELHPLEGKNRPIVSGSKLRFNLDLLVNRSCMGVSFEVVLRDSRGTPVAFSPFGLHANDHHSLDPGHYQYSCILDPPSLADGCYSIDLLAAYAGRQVLDHLESCLAVNVTGVPTPFTGWVHRQASGQGVLIIGSGAHRMAKQEIV